VVQSDRVSPEEAALVFRRAGELETAGTAVELSPARLLRGGAVAAITSGLPSTAWALLTGADPLAAARAAGTLLPGRGERPSLVGGVIVHIGVSAAWTTVFGLAARRWRLGAVRGAIAGLGIATLDLCVVGRRFPRIAALPRAAQWADHVAFGVVLGRALRPAAAHVSTGPGSRP
jgi:hypothetical protein